MQLAYEWIAIGGQGQEDFKTVPDLKERGQGCKRRRRWSFPLRLLRHHLRWILPLRQSGGAATPEPIEAGKTKRH